MPPAFNFEGSVDGVPLMGQRATRFVAEVTVGDHTAKIGAQDNGNGTTQVYGHESVTKKPTYFPAVPSGETVTLVLEGDQGYLKVTTV